MWGDGMGRVHDNVEKLKNFDGVENEQLDVLRIGRIVDGCIEFVVVVMGTDW